MNIRKRRIYLMLCMAIFYTIGYSQYSPNSPYSRIGIGDPVDNNFMTLRSMGGVGASYVDAFNINIVNPASYGFLDVTSFDIGIFAKYSQLDDGTQNEGLWNGNIGYISLGFPLSNPINEILDRVERKSSWGMNFTLMPHSSVGYNVSAIDSIPDIGRIQKEYVGTGGSYKFMWGNSYRYKNFSAGLNLGYLFGKIEYQRNVYFGDVQGAFDNEFNYSYSLNGFLWNAGVIYKLDLNKKQREIDRNIPSRFMTFGLHANSSTSFNTNAAVLERSVVRYGTGTDFAVDTLNYVLDSLGSGRLPAEIGFGLSYYNGSKSAISASYTYTKWSGYENDANQGNLSDTYKVSLGGFFRPNYKSFTSYFKRMYYRWGLYYGTDPRFADQDQSNSYGLNIGFGLPFRYQRKISHANIGLEFGRRGSDSEVQERFATINFSFTFNDDEWFIKRKYD